MPHAAILAVASYLPERRLTNADLERLVDTSDEWIVSRTGICERHVAAPDEGTSDLAAKAGAAALARAGVAPAEVDLLIVATSSPDMLFPATACLVARKMGLSCPAFDLSAACTGFIYAIGQATSAIESGRSKTVLVIGADVLTRLIDFTDRGTCILFGDGAGALVMRASEKPGVLGVHLGADGSGADLLSLPAGGSARPCSIEALRDGGNFIKMNGSEVFKFAVRQIPIVTRQALEESGLTVDDVTWLVPHQANTRITATVAERLGIPAARVVERIADVGNTSTASIPLALDALYTGGNLHAGDVLALVGFGAGLTWGAAIVTWTGEE
jgi:3-oxoacyl-[acyl-carrier-protein] synthase-3